MIDSITCKQNMTAKKADHSKLFGYFWVITTVRKGNSLVKCYRSNSHENGKCASIPQTIYQRGWRSADASQVWQSASLGPLVWSTRVTRYLVCTGRIKTALNKQLFRTGIDLDRRILMLNLDVFPWHLCSNRSVGERHPISAEIKGRSSDSTMHAHTSRQSTFLKARLQEEPSKAIIIFFHSEDRCGDFL